MEFQGKTKFMNFGDCFLRYFRKKREDVDLSAECLTLKIFSLKAIAGKRYVRMLMRQLKDMYLIHQAFLTFKLHLVREEMLVIQ